MSMNSRDYLEKRDFIRMRIDSPVEVHIAGHDSPISGMCRDLSGGGMLIEVDTALPAGSEVEVTLASNHGHAPMLRAIAVVTRISGDANDESGTQKVGLQLKDILS